MRAVDVHSKKLVQEYQLTGPQLMILREIMHRKKVTIGELAKHVSLSNATVTGIVDRLERRGLVRRSRGDRDRRKVLVTATRAAEEIMASAPPLLQERFIEALNRLETWERAQMLSALDKIARMMNAENLDVGPVLFGEPLTEGEETRASGETRREKKMTTKEKKNVYEYADVNLKIHVVNKPEEMPSWIDRDQLAQFLHESLKPYEDTVEDIQRAFDYVFSEAEGKGGFILIGESDGKPLGALVMAKTGMSGYIPENILIFVAVSPEARGKGVGGKIVQLGFDLAEGDVKLHVEYDNPAKRLYERLGMTTKYAEMRYTK
jgi:DNA-binding MarR family transcriptional regulator/GNAT superfamily N-acetyltransferase